MTFEVQAWTVSTGDEEEPCATEMVESKKFDFSEDARLWAWDRMEEGFFVCMFRR